SPEPNELDARRELARDFRIESLLARPPGPIVYLARDAEERPLALKVVSRAQAGPAEQRFHAAADAAAQLDHPHIVPVYRHGATENFLWCATKYVDGQSLASMLQTGEPLELSVCLRIFEQVASALDYAHRRGVAHGALTPDSIIVDGNEWALVGDFAIAGPLDAAPAGGHASQPAAGADPREKGPGSPVVIVDADADPAAKHLGGRLAAATAGLLVALGGGAAWLGISSIPASPASRDPGAGAPAPVRSAPPAAPSATSDTFVPYRPDS